MYFYLARVSILFGILCLIECYDANKGSRLAILSFSNRSCSGQTATREKRSQTNTKTNAHEIGVASSGQFHIINVLKMPADYTEDDEDPLVALVQQLELTAGA